MHKSSYVVIKVVKKSFAFGHSTKNNSTGRIDSLVTPCGHERCPEFMLDQVENVGSKERVAVGQLLVFSSHGVFPGPQFNWDAIVKNIFNLGLKVAISWDSDEGNINSILKVLESFRGVKAGR